MRHIEIRLETRELAHSDQLSSEVVILKGVRVIELRLSIHAISDPRKISEIDKELDSFIIKNSNNPFMLSVFIKKRMERALLKGSSPTVLIFMTDGKIVGIAPLLIRKKFGIRFVEWLFDYPYSPDFIFDTKYSEVCMKNSFNHIFSHLKCWFAILEVPAESQNLQIIERTCKTNHISIRKKNDARLNHRVVDVACAWDDFKKSRGKDFRAEFKNIERKLCAAGKYQVLIFENRDHEQDAFQKIIDIEKTSWKQNWRLHHHASDDGLMSLWEGSNSAIRNCPDFKRGVWFLELNGHVIAYSLVVQYKETAYIAKTSFNSENRKLYPGIYIFNRAIRDLFNSGSIKTIDLMTNLSFMKKWASLNLLRIRLLLWKGVLPNLLVSLVQRRQPRRIMRYLFPGLSQILA